ncbi:MipA/OmpV family protein [Pseudoalteromonas sp. NBT06-2]|uniref:MipA/OmpV family protein n=1 Tax=Pseudoalteromonas sp. NBT06-2 TaxID=2025950 RepID=UPI00336BE5D7
MYKGYDYRIIPLPIIGYRNEKWSVLGPFIKYDALNVSDITLSIQAAPRFQGFNKSDSYIFENMEKRKVSIDTGIGLSYEKQNWKINLSNMFDVLGNSNGYEAKANISRVFNYGSLFFEPKLSISYLNDTHVDYYYGVKPNEINAFIWTYQGQSAINATIGLSLSTPVFFDGFTSLSLEYAKFDSGITQSPLVENDNNLNVRFLFSKFFE